MDTLELKIIGSDEMLLHGPARSVLLDTDSGQIEILAGHETMITRVNVSILTVTLPTGKTQDFFVNGGLVQVTGEEVTITCVDGYALDPKTGTLKEYVEKIKQKRALIQEAMKKAQLQGGQFEQSVDQIYLLEEERLAKFELYQELLK
jgi:F0F1-type ATP synthase epsilon subunit